MDSYINLNRPIIISPYQDNWATKYTNERYLIKNHITGIRFIIEHIGSTSVKGLSAKPIIDIVIAVKNRSYDYKLIKYLEKLEYHYLPEMKKQLPKRSFLWKGSRMNHEFHIHIVAEGSNDHSDLILFREYLRRHPIKAQEYADLKITLAEQCVDNIGAYVLGKHHLYRSYLNSAYNETNL